MGGISSRCLDHWFVVNCKLYFIGLDMSTYFAFFIIICVGIVSYSCGRQSVEPVIPMCQETNLTLVASRINKDEVVCVYVESWQIKGKTKRIENVIQKKTT